MDWTASIRASAARREQLVNPALATVLSAVARPCLLHVLWRLLCWEGTNRPGYVPAFIIQPDYNHCMPGRCWPSNWATAVLPEATCSTRGAARRVVCCSAQSLRASCADFVACACKRLLQATISTEQACGVARVSAAPPAQLSTQWCRGTEMGIGRLQCGISAQDAVSMSAHQAARSVVRLQRVVPRSVARGTATRVNLARMLERKQAAC